MDSGALLDLLGNENRRRILQLLARKPCYVTEISDYLGVSPKAVIDHLRKLEEAGLVESRVDDQRRKYFHISRNLRLEVSVSPHGFGMKSAYPASASLDLTRLSYLEVSVDCEADGDACELAAELDELGDLERELSLAQRWVQGRLAEVREELRDSFEDVDDDDARLFADLLVAVAGGTLTTRELAEELDLPPQVVGTSLSALAEQGLVDRGEDGWRLTGPV
jgi:ArsR family transcriptional regulator